MMRLGMWSGWKWVGIGMVAVAVGVLGVASFAWSRRDPWPARAVISLPRDCWPQRFSGDGRSYWVASWAVNEPKMIAWDLATGKRQPPPKEPMISPLSSASDGRSYLGVMAAKPDKREVVWLECGSDAIRARFPVGASLVVKANLADGCRSIRAILGSINGAGRCVIKEVVTWDIASGAESRRPFTGPSGVNITGVAFSPDDRLYASFDKSNDSIRIWDMDAGRPQGKLIPVSQVPSSQRPVAVFTPDGKTLIVGRGDGRAEFWDVAESRLVKTLKIHPSGYEVGLINPSPDGRTLTSTGWSSSKSAAVKWIWSGFSRVAPGWTAYANSEAVVIDLATGQILARSPGSISSEFSPDGRTMVTREWNWTLTIRDAPQPSHPHQ